LNLKVPESFATTDASDLLPVLILAGGLATRLWPLTERIPKALIEVAGRPFLWHQLQLLKKNGVRRVVLALGYLGEDIRKRFGDGSEVGVSLEYSFDGPKPLGTAGAIEKHYRSCPNSSSCSTAIPTLCAITDP